MKFMNKIAKPKVFSEKSTTVIEVTYWISEPMHRICIDSVKEYRGMTNTLKSLALAAATLIAFSTSASAIDRQVRGYGAMLAQAETKAKVPASYRFIKSDASTPARIKGQAKYFGGAIRVIMVNGTPVRLPQSEIIENVRNGHFVPVYIETGERLKRDDWEVSLPHWLGYATSEYAGQ